MDKRSRTDKSLYVLAVVAVFWILSLPLVRLTQLLEPIRRQVATETLSIEGDFRPGGYFDVHFTGKPVPALLGKHKIRMLIEPAPTETDWRIAEYGASGRWERLTEYRPGASYRAMTVVNVVPVYTPPICYRIPRNEVYGKEIVLQILVEVDYPTPVRNGFQIQTDRFSSAEKIVLRPDAGTVVPFFQRDPALMEPRWLGLLVFIAWFLGVVLAIGMGISISLDPPALKRLHQTR